MILIVSSHEGVENRIPIEIDFNKGGSFQGLNQFSQFIILTCLRAEKNTFEVVDHKKFWKQLRLKYFIDE